LRNLRERREIVQERAACRGLRCIGCVLRIILNRRGVLEEAHQRANANTRERIQKDHVTQTRRFATARTGCGGEQRKRDGGEQGFDQTASAVEQAEEAALFVGAGDHAHALEHRGPERQARRQAPAAEDHQQHMKRRRSRIPESQRARADQRKADQQTWRNAVGEPAAWQIGQKEDNAEHRVEVAKLRIVDMEHIEHRGLIDLAQIENRINGARGQHEQQQLPVALHRA
jgi:hypothetical protein